MKAMVLTKHAPIATHPLILSEVDKPVPHPHELLVAVKACGVCRTDLHLIEGDLQPGPLPIIPGHQVVGVVAQVGAKTSRFKVGDRVGVAWLGYTCQSCAYCKSERENLCNHSRYKGYMENGGYAEFVTVLEDYAYAIPETFDDAEATPLLCAGIIGYRAYKCAQVPAEGALGIFGFGSSAHIVIQIALAHGCQVYVSTRNENHQRLAKAMGAHLVGGSEESLPCLVDSALVFAPVGSVVPTALRALKKGGTAVLAGIAMSDIPSLNYEETLFHEKKLVSVEANTRNDGRELLELAQVIPIKPRIATYKLHEANEVLQKLKLGKIDGTAVLTL
jgi:propanol-preferring alcohol dehydrogenase